MISKRVQWAMAAGAGLAVANNYYAQPLLAEMGREFRVDDWSMGVVSMLAQVGYVLGLLLFVPLGDRLERRSFVLLMLGASLVALLGVAAAPGIYGVAVGILAVGVTTISPQLLIPFAAHLAEPAERGRVVGTVMSGLLIGILGARTLSGVVGGAYGWRVVYGLAALMMVGLAVALRLLLPRSEPAPTGLSYPALMRSIGHLVRAEPVLRQSCIFGGMGCAGFMAFWTTLVFHLARPPLNYSSAVAGAFGLVGIVGALAAPLAGRLADRRNPRNTIVAGQLCVLASFGIFWAWGWSLWGLVAGVILLDLGVQASHISNQSRIFALAPEARSRLNTAYMVSYFSGGAFGSSAGAWGWSRAGWPGVCAVGAGVTVLGLIAFAATGEASASPRRALDGPA